MKKWLVASSLLVTGAVQGAGVVDFLKVEDDVMLFSTTQTKGDVPNCVSPDSTNLWSVSLSSSAGRALYSLVLTAMSRSDNTSIVVESAEDCGAKTGIERAAAIDLITIPESQVASSSGQKTTGIYRHDGSRVGTLVQAIDEATWLYSDREASTVLKKHHNHSQWRYENNQLFYESDDCSGDPFSIQVSGALEPESGQPSRYEQGSIVYTDKSPSPRLYKYSFDTSNHEVRVRRSMFRFDMGATPECFSMSPRNQNTTIRPYTDPLCGDHLCIIREDD